MAFIIKTPQEQNITQRNLVENISCKDYTEEIKQQKRVVTPLDIQQLQQVSRAFKNDIISRMPGITLYQAMTFSRTELELLVNTAGDDCAYVRIYTGIENGTMTQFAIPVNKELNPILSSNIVCISDLPCPPRTGCPNDIIVG